LAVHAGAGLQNLNLLRLVELALVVRRDTGSGALAWDAFVAAGRRAGALGYAFPALHLSNALCPGLISTDVLAACAQHAPAGVARFVQRLTPATAQRVDRTSLAEHFMWSRGWADHLRQLAADVAPAVGAWERLWSVYERRAWQLIRGGFSP